MSGKFTNQKKKSPRRGTPKVLWIALILSTLLCCTMIVLAWCVKRSNETEMNAPEAALTETTEPAAEPESQTDPESRFAFELDENLAIIRVGGYTGAYMEEGSDDLVSGVMMIVVSNHGEETLPYAQITLSGGSDDAVFKLSTLKPGETVVVLETNRKEYHTNDSYTSASVANVVYFAEPVSMYEDVLEIQPLDGGFNISNISDQDITGKITIYFKDTADGIFYGGITYRGSITGGMKAGEIRQVMSENFSASGSAVVFITITEE